MAKELGVDAKYSVKLIPNLNAEGGMTNLVCVELSDSSDAAELWSLKTFHAKYGLIMQEYMDNKEKLKSGASIELDKKGPFYVSHHSLQTIGHIKVVLGYINYGMPVEDNFAIISQAGVFSGTCGVKVQALFTDEQNAQLEASEENGQDEDDEDSFTTIDVINWEGQHLDLEIEIVECKSLPKTLASDVRVSLMFPRFVGTVMLPTPEEQQALDELKSKAPQR